MCSSFNVPPSGIIWFVKVISTDLSLPRDRQFYEIKELYIKDYIKTKKDEPNYENPICIALSHFAEITLFTISKVELKVYLRKYIDFFNLHISDLERYICLLNISIQY